MLDIETRRRIDAGPDNRHTQFVLDISPRVTLEALRALDAPQT